jgi:O-antigen ligase/Tfp pilus assembly protein PilF
MHRFIYWTFISILIFSPLAFGAVERWSLTLMETASLSAFLLFFLSGFKKKSLFHEVPGLVPLILLGAYIFAQIVPLPPGLVRFFSPATFTLYGETVGSIEPIGWISLSINPKATLSEFFRFSAYLSIYILTVQLLTNRDDLRNTIKIVIVFATLLAIQAMIQHFMTFTGGVYASHKIFWFRDLAHGGAPFGPYVNRNHYAGWMGMIFPMALGMFLFHQPPGGYRSFREKIVGFLTHNEANSHILFGVSVILTSVTIFLTLSRGGIISLCLASLFFACMVTAIKPGHRKGGMMVGVFIIVLLCVGWFGWEPIFQRFDSIRDGHGDIAGQRLTIWKDSLNIARDFPVTGSGFGTFKDIYPKYRHFSGNLIVKHAENDYLEFMAGGGIVGVFLILWFLGIVLYKSARAFRKRKDTYSAYLYLGTLSGIVSILIHGLIDFNLHIGANGLYFFFLLGVAVSAANTRISYQRSDTYLTRHPLPRPMIVGPLVAGACLFILFTNGFGFMGELSHASIKDIRLTANISETTLAEILRRSRRACRLDPLEARFRFTAANIDAFRKNDDQAMEYYKAALRRNPTRGVFLHRLAVVVSGHGYFDIADKLFRAGLKYDPGRSERSLGYATWLLSKGRTQDAVLYLARALDLDPRLTGECLTLMVIHGLTEKQMQAALPERVVPHLRFADFLLQMGNHDMAEAMYRRSLEFIKKEKPIKWTYFDEVYQFYMKNERHKDALDVMLKSVKILPENLHLRLRLADLYQKTESTSRAIEEYRKVLMIDPNNRTAQKFLNKISNE